jgi:hypothetical protein
LWRLLLRARGATKHAGVALVAFARGCTAA